MAVLLFFLKINCSYSVKSWCQIMTRRLADNLPLVQFGILFIDVKNCPIRAQPWSANGISDLDGKFSSDIKQN